MSIKVTSRDGRVSVEADEGSTVENVTVNGENINIGSPRQRLRWWSSRLFTFAVTFALAFGLAHLLLQR